MATTAAKITTKMNKTMGTALKKEHAATKKAIQRAEDEHKAALDKLWNTYIKAFAGALKESYKGQPLWKLLASIENDGWGEYEINVEPDFVDASPIRDSLALDISDYYHLVSDEEDYIIQNIKVDNTPPTADVVNFYKKTYDKYTAISVIAADKSGGDRIEFTFYACIRFGYP